MLLNIIVHIIYLSSSILVYSFSCRGLCPDFYPDEICRFNYSKHAHDPPLLYDLTSDPSEIYSLSVTEYSDVMAQINKVWQGHAVS